MSGDTGFRFLSRTPEEWLAMEAERNSLRRQMLSRSSAPPAVTVPFYARHRPSAAPDTNTLRDVCERASRTVSGWPEWMQQVAAPPLTAPERPTRRDTLATEFEALERCYTLAENRIAELADMVARLTVENVRLRRGLGHD